MKKILVVDDQLEVRDLVEVTLRTGEYAIIMAENGKQAVEMAKKEKPDLILMDVMMPGEMDGLDATRAIKESAETKDCIVIMLTAKGQQVDRRKGLDAGASEYFAKPFSPLELIKTVEKYINE